MSESISFDTNLYGRDVVERTAQQYRVRARIELEESEGHVVARLEPLAADEIAAALRDEFCNEVFSATAKKLRSSTATESSRDGNGASNDEPPWGLLAPAGKGTDLGLGWVLDSLSPIRSGAATLGLRHAEHGIAKVNIRRNGGSPVGVVHTDRLDFMVSNGGGGTARTEPSIAAALGNLARALQATGSASADDGQLMALLPHSEAGGGAAKSTNGTEKAPRRIAPRIDDQTIRFDVSETGIDRLALYDAVLAFADRCYVYLTRPAVGRIGLHLRPRGETSTEAMRVLTRDVTNSINRVARRSSEDTRSRGSGNDGLPALARRRVDMDALLAELEAADPATLGLGFEPERGPGHQNLRVLNIRGTGACDSECIFCIEKFNPTHRSMPNNDTTRQFILDNAGRSDMLFFASGEPTIHPKLFDYVELARSVGYTCFGMSSHFRTFADPRFALKTLEAGFQYFDIALHAADRDSQLAVNPIEDDGESLFEALKGLANLFRLADALGIRISVTQKIVVSRLNVTSLEAVFRATYERGVRHFILQPVRSLGLEPDRQAKLEITEEEILPHLNALLQKTEGLGAVVKPYGFSRQHLFAGSHIESEQNRVKNIYGKARRADDAAKLPANLEERPTDGRHWVEVRNDEGGRSAFASDGSAPILDGGLARNMVLNFGCRMGSCGMCCARLIEGRVDQSTQIFLSEEQIRQGYVLLCQARPLSDVTVQVCTHDEIDQL